MECRKAGLPKRAGARAAGHPEDVTLPAADGPLLRAVLVAEGAAARGEDDVGVAQIFEESLTMSASCNSMGGEASAKTLQLLP